jgi:hypothetical protein
MQQTNHTIKEYQKQTSLEIKQGFKGSSITSNPNRN